MGGMGQRHGGGGGAWRVFDSTPSPRSPSCPHLLLPPPLPPPVAVLQRLHHEHQPRSLVQGRCLHIATKAAWPSKDGQGRLAQHKHCPDLRFPCCAPANSFAKEGNALGGSHDAVVHEAAEHRGDGLAQGALSNKLHGGGVGGRDGVGATASRCAYDGMRSWRCRPQRGPAPRGPSPHRPPQGPLSPPPPPGAPLTTHHSGRCKGAMHYRYRYRYLPDWIKGFHQVFWPTCAALRPAGNQEYYAPITKCKSTEVWAASHTSRCMWNSGPLSISMASMLRGVSSLVSRPCAVRSLMAFRPAMGKLKRSHSASQYWSKLYVIAPPQRP